MTTTVEEIARLIGANVDGLDYSLTGDANVFEEDWPNDPDVAVMVSSYGGPEAHAKFPSDEHRVQLMFRASPEDPTSATALWQAAFDYLHALRRVELSDGSTLSWVLAMQAAPVSIGADDNGRQRFTMNLRCERQRPSGNRP